MVISAYTDVTQAESVYAGSRMYGMKYRDGILLFVVENRVLLLYDERRFF